MAKDGEVKPLECIVRAGEVIYVPQGWWHCVLNTEHTIAITQNYVGAHNLPHVLEFLRDRFDLSPLCSPSVLLLYSVLLETLSHSRYSVLLDPQSF